MQESTAASVVKVSAADEHAAIVEALQCHGAELADAEIQARMLVEADLRGHASHGIRRVPVLAERLRVGLATSGIAPVHTWSTDSCLIVDGRRGLGPVVAHAAVEAALERVQQQGIVITSVQNSGHAGMLAPYLEQMTEAGCAGIALTVSEALVHPWGGASALIGTNPIGIGVPTSAEPLILDMSTGQTSAGKILDYAARGAELPAGWAIDSDGDPTTDADAATKGAISPFGGPKGYALGIALEAFVGVLTGAAFGLEVAGTLDTVHPPTKGDLFIVISLDALSSSSQLAALSGYLDEVRASGVDGQPVTVPGDRARELRSERLEKGIPLDGAAWRHVQDLGKANA